MALQTQPCNNFLEITYSFNILPMNGSHSLCCDCLFKYYLQHSERSDTLGKKQEDEGGTKFPLGEFLLPSHYPAGLVASVRKTRCLPGTWRGRLPSKHQSWLWGKHGADHVSHRPNVSVSPVSVVEHRVYWPAQVAPRPLPGPLYSIMWGMTWVPPVQGPVFFWSLFPSFSFLNVPIS